MQFSDRHEDADGGPRYYGTIHVPVIDPPLLLSGMTIKSCLVLVDGSIEVSFSFKRPDHHDLVTLNIETRLALFAVVVGHNLFGNCNLYFFAKH